MAETRRVKDVPGGVVRRMRPRKAEAAPSAEVSAGRGEGDGRRAGRKVRSGTRTTTRPVTKADLAGVVRERPRVWNW